MGIDSHFLHRCDIQRGESLTDPYHNDAPPTWRTITSDVSCRLVMKAQRVFSTETAQSVEITKYLLLLPSGTDILADDKIGALVDEAGVESGPYSVLSVLPRRTRTTHHISAELEVIA